MSHVVLLLLLALGFGSLRSGFGQEASWAAPPSGIVPEIKQLHVISSAQKSLGDVSTTYTVDTWYFENELVARIRSDASDMIAYEDKKKTQAAYWEKGIDKTTPYFPKQFIDGYLADLIPHSEIWFYQNPIRNIMKPEGAKKESDSQLSVTTVTLKIPNPSPGVTNYISAVYKGGNITAIHTAGDLGGERDDIYVVNYSHYSGSNKIPQSASYIRNMPPFKSIVHSVSPIRAIPPNMTAQALLAQLTKGYRPITMRRLNDAGEVASWTTGATGNWWLRVAAAGAALIFLLYAVRRVSTRGRR